MPQEEENQFDRETIDSTAFPIIQIWNIAARIWAAPKCVEFIWLCLIKGHSHSPVFPSIRRSPENTIIAFDNIHTDSVSITQTAHARIHVGNACLCAGDLMSLVFSKLLPKLPQATSNFIDFTDIFLWAKWIRVFRSAQRATILIENETITTLLVVVTLNYVCNSFALHNIRRSRPRNMQWQWKFIHETRTIELSMISLHVLHVPIQACSRQILIRMNRIQWLGLSKVVHYH